MKGYTVPFAIAFLACGAAFFAMDYAVMGMQGLSLFFTP